MSGKWRLDLWRAHKGPALGATKSVFGRAWFYVIPRIQWRDWQLVVGRIRSLSLKWMQFCVEIVYMTENIHPKNVSPIIGQANRPKS